MNLWKRNLSFVRPEAVLLTHKSSKHKRGVIVCRTYRHFLDQQTSQTDSQKTKSVLNHFLSTFIKNQLYDFPCGPRVDDIFTPRQKKYSPLCAQRLLALKFAPRLLNACGTCCSACNTTTHVHASVCGVHTVQFRLDCQPPFDSNPGPASILLVFEHSFR